MRNERSRRNGWLRAVTALLLFGVGSAFGQTELTIAHAMTGGADREAFDAIVAAFEEQNPEITVRQIVQDDDLYQDAGLITLLQSNDPPDIYFQWGGALVARDAAAGYAADLSEALAQDGWGDSFVDAAWSAPAGTTYESGIYLIPNTLDVTTALWYNVDIFDEHGISVPETWADLVAASATLAEAGVTPIILGNQEYWPLGNWAGHITARVVGMERFDAAFRLEEPFSQPAFVEAFERIAELAEVGAFNADMAGLGADPAMNAFFQGAAAMHPIGSWLVPIATESAPEGFNYDVFNTPVIEGGAGDPTSVIGLATGFEVSASTDAYDAAIAFLKFFSSQENQVTWAEAGAFSPVEGAMAAADLDPHTQSLAALFDGAGEIVPPPDTGYPVEIADAFYQGAAQVAGGVRSPEEALQWVDQQVAHLRER